MAVTGRSLHQFLVVAETPPRAAEQMPQVSASWLGSCRLLRFLFLVWNPGIPLHLPTNCTPLDGLEIIRVIRIT